jgi:chaperonin GroEL
VIYGNVTSFKRILEVASVTGAYIVVVGPDFSSEVISTLIVNHLRGAIKGVGIKITGLGDSLSLLLSDISAVTGAAVYG